MPRPERLAGVCAPLLALACATPAAAQGLAAHLPRGPSQRPLHERLALADAAAIGTIRAVELGRIQVEAVTPLWGSPAESFALKRAPSRAPPLQVGDRALLILRGARSPYLLVDRPEEVRIVANSAAEARWRTAFEALGAAGEAPEALRDLYLAWLAGSDTDLRELARLALASPEAPFAPLPSGIAASLLDDAVDPALESGRRRAAAAVVLAHPEAASELLQRLGRDPDRDDPEILRAALAVGVLRRLAELEPLLARALLHPDPEVRAGAAELSATAASSPLARSALERMAAEDPRQDLRQQARRALTDD